MTPSLLHTFALGTFTSLLERLQHVLEKSQHYATAHSLDSSTWLTCRLAPDMFPLARQIQAACDHAKDTAARLKGQEPPVFENTEQTLEQLQARVSKTLAYLAGVTPAMVEGVEARVLSRPLPKNRVLKLPALQFIRDWALPQFYFHLVTAYDILRQQGVDLGKRDFLSDIWGAVETLA